MENAQDRHLFGAALVIDDIGISGEWQPPNRRPLFDALGCFRVVCDVIERPTHAGLDVLCAKPTARANESENVVKLCKRKPRENEPHRCFANTASTSSALATSPRLTAASASSIFSSSSRVAR